MHILLIKTSSMGDVIHTLPAVTDLMNHHPGIRIDWVVEEGFAEIPRMHPAVDRVLPVSIRRWRKAWWTGEVRRELREFKASLRERHYDLAIDAQGLIKSAWMIRQVDTVRCGYDRHSIREAVACLAYDRCYPVSWSVQAVTRNRLLLNQALGDKIDTAIDYGIRSPGEALPWLKSSHYAVMLHATSREDKEWAPEHWIELGRLLAQRGLVAIFPWGNEREHARAFVLAAQLPGAQVAPRLSLRQAATLLAASKITIGLDTGLTHLAAALAVPVVAIYSGSEPGLTGVMAPGLADNLGAMGKPPTLEEVWQSAERLLAIGVQA